MSKIKMVEVHPVVWEQLWRVVDAARMSIAPYHGQTRDEALTFLADEEKMLRRALGGDVGEDNVRRGMLKHPYTIAMAAAHNEAVEASRRQT